MAKPNIVYIYPDQMRYDAMSHTGNPVIETPALDQMAKDSVSFSHAYTSFPVCCPYRASLMTGKYTHKHGLYTNHYPIENNQEFLPEILGRHGYYTGWIGKWHLNGGRQYDFVEKDMRCGFQRFIGYSRGHHYHTGVFYRDDDPTPRKSNDYEPVFQTKHLMEFIDDAQKEEKPFFASICYGLPHPPLEAPEAYLTQYSPEQVPIQPTVPEDGEAKAREFTAKYYGLVKVVDEEVGKILQGLESRGLLDNTVVILASDHGEMAGEHGKYAKIVIHEASMHVPFLIRYPKAFKPHTRDNMVDPSVDIFPTILELCGIDVPDYADGESLVSQCEDETLEANKKFVYFQNIRQPFADLDKVFPAARGIRTAEFCYEEDEGTPVKFYDLRNDPMETNNLIGRQEYADTQAGLHQLLVSEMDRLGDDWDVQYDHSLPDFQGGAEAKIWMEALYARAQLEA